MPNAIILRQLGLFVRRQFLSAESCRQIRREMAAVDRIPAIVRPHGQAAGKLDHETRRTGIANVSASTVGLVEDQLRAIQPALEQYFQLRSGGWQALEFCVYDAGDFFAPHHDTAADPMVPDYIRARRISVSILLNDAQSGIDAEPYEGGTLVFHGRRGDGFGPEFRVPLEGEEGMFVAFRSEWLHEVRPITGGRRYSIVTWFF